MTKHQLPLFEDKTLLPTGKHHVSYSEISDWMDCSERHRLKHIQKIDLDKPSIHTEFGKAIHDALEGFVMSRTIPDPVATEKVFEELMEALRDKHGVTYPEKELASFRSSIPGILEAAPKFLDKEFPGWKGHAAELPLFEAVDGQVNKRFKGFVDAVLLVPRKKRGVHAKKHKEEALEIDSKHPPMRFSDLLARHKSENSSTIAEEVLVSTPPKTLGEPTPGGLALSDDYDYFIMDWKTTSFGWDPMKKRDFQKQLQLMLYKHFFCKLANVPLDRVKCGFVLLKRTARKSDGSRVELVPVSVGPKAEEKALAVLHDMINQI